MKLEGASVIFDPTQRDPRNPAELSAAALTDRSELEALSDTAMIDRMQTFAVHSLYRQAQDRFVDLESRRNMNLSEPTAFGKSILVRDLLTRLEAHIETEGL